MGSVASVPAGSEPEKRQRTASIEERRALLDRIAASSHFRRSARLRDFLLYVGGQSLLDETREIREQEIGAKVFGRPSAYDRSQDNIVRVAATELRKRIELYYASEGLHETLLLDIPRGGYKPVFHWRHPPDSHPALQPVAVLPQAPTPAVAPAVAPALAPPHSPGWRVHTVWATICLALLIAGAFLYRHDRATHRLLYTWESRPALSLFWKSFFDTTQSTDIILPDASLTIREELTGLPISLPDYINRHYLNETRTLPLSDDRRHDLDDIFGHNLVAFGDFQAAQQILALSPAGSSLHFTLARFFQADSVKHDNLILIGGKKANPWIYLFDDQMNFSLGYDNVRDLSFVTNRHPAPGESATYASSGYPNGFVGYCVVAYLPNPSHTGNVIIITGTDSDATEAAAEFLTSEDQLRKLQSALHVREFPSFELLLKTSRLSGTSFNAEILAFRTHPNLK